MIKTYSQRLTPPYSGQVQIAESDRARALTMDAEIWEIHFAKDSISTTGTISTQRSYRRAAYLNQKQMRKIAEQSPQENKDVDQRIIELAIFLQTASLPFPATDHFEYWLLDRLNSAPLAMIFSCSDADKIKTFPTTNEWTALPAAISPIEKTDAEIKVQLPPVNYRVEQLIREHAGNKPKAQWFQRSDNEIISFPSFMIREHWTDQADTDLCKRYLDRQSTRLLMLHNISHEDRLRMENAAKAHIFEVARFFPLYPQVADEKLMNAMRVEARLRSAESREDDLQNRRDGVHYQ